MVSEQLLAAIEGYGGSVYALAQASGVPQPTLSRFVRRERGLTLETVDRLCEALGLELTAKGGKGKGAKGKAGAKGTKQGKGR